MIHKTLQQKEEGCSRAQLQQDLGIQTLELIPPPFGFFFPIFVLSFFLLFSLHVGFIFYVADGVLKAGTIATDSLLRLYILIVLPSERKGSPLSQHQIEKSHTRKEWNNRHCGQGVENCYQKKVYHHWGVYSLNLVFSSVWSALSKAESGVPKSFFSIYIILMFKELVN